MAIMIYGKNAVRECVRDDRVTALKVAPKQSKDEIVSEAKAKHIPVEIVNHDDLTRIAKNPSHQGFVAICKEFQTFSLEEILSSIQGKKEPLLLMLDGIEDPHNLGAILRSADAFGVDGVIMKKRGEVPLNATVAKVSTGAISYVKVCTVTNLNQAIKKLQDNGFWVVCSDGSGKMDYDEVDYHCPICLIVGSEGFGTSRLVVEHSDFVVKIPMVGHVNSLNASVATGILLAGIALKRK